MPPIFVLIILFISINSCITRSSTNKNNCLFPYVINRQNEAEIKIRINKSK